MQPADQHAPNVATATATATAAPGGAPMAVATTAGARRRRAGRLRSQPQVRGQELAALEWQRLGACHQADQSVFFAPDTPGEPRADRRRRVVAAKAVCALCPVRDLCRNYALENQEEYGVWGGLSETERKDLIAARRRGSEHGGRTQGGGVPAIARAGHV